MTPVQITTDHQKSAEKEIKRKQQEVKYDLRDFTVGFLVQEFQDDVFYIPDYQRKFIWKSPEQCRFIESILLGLPIPMMFVAEMEEDGRLEIVDGAQRIQTLELFLSDELILKDLKKLPSVNGFKFSDFIEARQRKFEAKALRVVVLEDSTTPATRQEIFDRVNTAGIEAEPSEIRRGTYVGPFMDFVKECASNQLFQDLCPLGKKMRERYEGEELVIRFFAYSERYLDFKHGVEEFLDTFAAEKATQFNKNEMEKEFNEMLNFVKRNFPFGFGKAANSQSTPRVRFEAISVGVNLALRRRPDLIPKNVKKWLESKEFKDCTTTHASNSLPRLKGRVEYVRDQLLSK